MAEVFRRIRGEPIQRLIARHGDVQRRLKVEATRRGAIAEILLDERAKHRTDTSTISVEKGDIDCWIVLDDTRGLHAALSIEYGRGSIVTEHPDGSTTINPATEGLWVLHDAAGLPHPGGG